MRVHQSCEGDSACDEQANHEESLIPPLSLPSGNVWSCLQNNATNEYYFSLADGSWNNNNKNNSYNAVPVEPEDFGRIIFEAEDNCWANKHSSWDAVKYHYHYGKRIFELVKSIAGGQYEPWRSICFVILYPRPREVFAAHYQDRIAHHVVAPYILSVAEAAHRANGDMSFGNRRGVSAYHACRRLQSMMRRHPDGYVASWDIKGFFMSINKEVLWRVFCYFEQKYRPEGYSYRMRNMYMHLVRVMIFHDPTQNCERNSPMEMWGRYIAPEKSLFGRIDHGVPIGNFYSQILANLLLAYVCERLRGRDVVEFVDDFASASDSVVEMHETERILSESLSEIGLRLHPTKKYVQPTRHGISWCGYRVYADRMYIDNRPKHNCMRKVNRLLRDVSLGNAIRLQQTVNSYIGMMCHMNEYGTQMRIRDRVMATGYSEYLYFAERPGRLVCRMRNQYRAKTRSIRDLEDILYNHKNRISMIVMPVSATDPHFEKKNGRFVYRYGYQPIEGSEGKVSAAVEEQRIRLKETAIRRRVTEYCEQVGIPNEYDPADYGY